MIVNKPWGYEYILYENDNVAIWHLVIDLAGSTSFHSHPHKKTGLVVLDGEAQLNFMNGFDVLGKFDKRIIRVGVFHQTINTGVEKLHLLEVETPKDKNDLLRLEDAYGRAGEPYEGPECYSDRPGDILFGSTMSFDWPETYKHTRFKDIDMSIRTCSNDLIDLNNIGDFKAFILEGCIHMDGIEAAGVGDLLDKKTLFRLADRFTTKFPLKLFIMQKVFDENNTFSGCF